MPIGASWQEVLHNAKFVLNIKVAANLIDTIIDSYENKTAVLPTATDGLNNNDEIVNDPEAYFTNRVAKLLGKKKISLAISIKLIGYSDQKQSYEEFSANVDKLSIAPDVTLQLKQAYQMQLVQSKVKEQQEATAKQSQDQPIKHQLTSWIQNGYVSRENDEYVTTVILDQGIIKMNGKALNVQLPVLPALEMRPVTHQTAIPSSTSY